MTIIPVGAGAGPSATGPSPAATGDGGVFDALVQQHLSDGGHGAGPSGEQVAAILEAASAPTALRSDSLAALLAGLLVSSSTASTTGASGATGATDATGTTGMADATDVEAAAAAEAMTEPAATVAPAASDASPAVVTAGVAGGTGASGPLTTSGASVAAQGDPGRPAEGLAPTSVVAQTETDALVPTRPTGDPAAAGGALNGPVAVPGAGDAAGTSTPETQRANPVADQVFGPVSRLVSRGDGTHRLMLRLHPADLGEVRVVMTVKDGVVDVTLSAGAAAREALRDGSPQLRSLLELAGATTGQVVVRELPSAAAAAGNQAGNQAGQPHDQAAPSGEQEGSSGSGAAADGSDTDAGNGEAPSTGAGGGTDEPAGGPAPGRATGPTAVQPVLRPASRLDLDL